MGDTIREIRDDNHPVTVLRPRKGSTFLADTHPELISQWHPDNKYSPDQVTTGSHYRAKWVCDKDSRHVWEARVLHRSHGRGCPVCLGRLVIAGVNDISTTHPELAAQWSSRNTHNVSEVTYGSNKKMWWKCPEGHEWDETPNKRTALGFGCPVCSGKRVIEGVNDLATTHPHVAEMVHASSVLKPTEVTSGSGKRMTWQCTSHLDHVWDSPVQEIVRGYGCPLCAGYRVVVGVNDLATTHPHLKGMWHPSNPPMTDLHEGSRTRVVLTCISGHTWSPVVRECARNGRGCPYCSGARVTPGVNDLATKYPELALEWHPKNPARPNHVAPQSNKRVWWVCGKGHEWFVTPNDRVAHRTGCPHCARTNFSSDGEKALASWVGSVYTGDVVRNARSVVQGHELDIYLPDLNLALEFNGLYYHSSKFRSETYHRDKTTDCVEKGVRLVHVWEHDWTDRMEIVKRMLSRVIGVAQERRVGARGTAVEVLTADAARDFFDRNHLQGTPRGVRVYGLIHSNDVVAALAVKRNGDRANISRYASSCNVPGGFTKLLHAAKPWAVDEGLTLWETFADLSWSRGDLYRTSGFTVEAELAPDYKYLRRGSLHHKFLFRKKRFQTDPSLKFEEGLTEKELAALNNMFRVYDCGKLRFVKPIGD